MYDIAWLDSLDELELNELYNHSRSRERWYRQHELWGLSAWWAKNAVLVVEALGRYYEANSNPFFARDQLSLPNMPCRINPDDRRAGA